MRLLADVALQMEMGAKPVGRQECRGAQTTMTCAVPTKGRSSPGGNATSPVARRPNARQIGPEPGKTPRRLATTPNGKAKRLAGAGASAARGACRARSSDGRRARCHSEATAAPLKLQDWVVDSRPESPSKELPAHTEGV
jgi:hypothetical protein